MLRGIVTTTTNPLTPLFCLFKVSLLVSKCNLASQQTQVTLSKQSIAYLN